MQKLSPALALFLAALLMAAFVGYVLTRAFA